MPKLIRFLISWGPALSWAGILFYLSSRTWDQTPPTFQINDKVIHLGLYVIMGAALAWAGRHKSTIASHGFFLLLGVLFALSDEWHQSFVPGRDPSAGDLVADFLGVVLGYLVFRAVFRGMFRAILKKRQEGA